MPLVCALVLLATVAHAARTPSISTLKAQAATGAIDADVGQPDGMAVDKRQPPTKLEFRCPKGLFIQERASKQLPGPGQHFSFGALVEWTEILRQLDARPTAKLLLLVRHGQALSNWLGDLLGPDEWYKWESKCAYENDTEAAEPPPPINLFDAELTTTGQEESKALNGMLAAGGWWAKLTGGHPVEAIVSPLSRCLQTAELVMQGIKVTKISVEENIRETLGEDSCDARRSVSSPADDDDPSSLEGPCEFDQGLAKKYPKFRFPVVNDTERQMRRTGLLDKRHGGSDKPEGLGFGMITDSDTMWTVKREEQKHQVKRAVRFMKDVFDLVEGRVAIVVTHSGTVRSLLLAVGREPYRPQNTELVPLLVDEIKPIDGGVNDDEIWSVAAVHEL
ncbi:hypothetical protein FOA52_010107 [Chlamydomonas sp. UWO 241]|nr:hypothetical protein FOA52_010107 [Chlamydomonas sp. UWO 241]